MTKEQAQKAFKFLSELHNSLEIIPEDNTLVLEQIGMFANAGYSSGYRASSTDSHLSPKSPNSKSRYQTLSDLNNYQEAINLKIEEARTHGFSSVSIIIGENKHSSKLANQNHENEHLLNHWVTLAFQKKNGKVEATLFNSLGNNYGYSWIEAEIKQYLPEAVEFRAIHTKLQNDYVSCLEYSTMYRVLLEYHNSDEAFPNPNSLNDRFLQNIATDAIAVVEIAKSQGPLEALTLLNEQNRNWAQDLRAFECLNAIKTQTISLDDIQSLVERIDNMNLSTDDPATLTLLASIVLIVSGLSIHISLITAFGVGGTALSSREIIKRLSKPPLLEELDHLKRAITLQP